MAVERQAISAASVNVKCDGLDVGWATGLDGEVTIELRDARVLNSADAQELKVVRRSVTFNLRTLRIPNLPAVALGWFIDGDSITLVKAKPLMFELLDEETGAVLKRLTGCKPTSLRFQVEEGSLFQESGSWRGLRCVDPDGGEPA